MDKRIEASFHRALLMTNDSVAAVLLVLAGEEARKNDLYEAELAKFQVEVPRNPFKKKPG